MRRRDELDLKILTYIFRHGSAPRPELVAYTGIRAATVFESVDRLKSSGLLIEPSRRGVKTGRRAPELKCNPDFAGWIGVELNTRHTLAVRTDNNGCVIDTAEIPAGSRAGVEDVFAEIFSALNDLQKRAGNAWIKVCGIGFSDPGTVDLEKGISLNAVNIPGWNEVDTAARISKETGLPCCLWSGEMVRAYQEYAARQKNPPARLVHLRLDNTIGAGFICDGRIYTGVSGQAMEIGHLSIDPAGPVCRCGKRGCLEACCSIPAIKEKLKSQGVEIPDDFKMSDLSTLEKKNPAVEAIVHDLASSVGNALIPVITLLNPDVIILCGETALLKDRLRKPILKILKENCLSGSADHLQITFSGLRHEDTARGAAILMRNRIILSQVVQ